MISRSWPWALVGAVVLGLVSARQARAVDDALQKKIEQAIAQGVARLRNLQDKNGFWAYPGIDATLGPSDATFGATALVALTLLECDVPPTDKAVQAGADFVRKECVGATCTYSISLAIMFLDRLGEPGDVALIDSLTVRLLAGQKGINGGWDYTCPKISEAEIRRLLDYIRERNELVSQGKLPKSRDGKRRTFKDLPKEIQAQLAAAVQGDRGGTGRTDNSNTQFAAIALWIARRHGLPVEDALNRVARGARASQLKSGAWGYIRPEGGNGVGMGIAKDSMTCSGLLQLAVAYGVKNAQKLEKNAGAKALVDPSKDPNVQYGLAALATWIGGTGPKGVPLSRVEGGENDYYFLWSLERTAVVYGLETIERKDWYSWGAKILLAKQGGDGGWSGKYSFGGVDTCFALLFLRKSNLLADLTSGRRKRGKAELTSGKLLPNQADPKSPKSKPMGEGADEKDEEAEIARMSAEVAKAAPERQEEILTKLEGGKLPASTDALASAIPALQGEIQEKARQALVRRLKRMKAVTLADKLKDENSEVRRAAAVACGKKMAKSLVPNLISLLEDTEISVGDAAHASLKDLTDKDFGPEANATRAERKEAAAKWKSWWKSQE